MSKQPNDQDEPQTASGASRGGTGNETEKGSASTKGRSRRRRGGSASAEAASTATSAAPAGNDGRETGNQSTTDGETDTAAKPSQGSQPASSAAGTTSSGTAASGAGGGKPRTASDAKATGSGAAKASGTAKAAGKSDPPAAGAKASDTSASAAKPAEKKAAGKPSGDPASPGGAGPTAGSGGGEGKGGGKAGVVALVLVILLGLAAVLFGWQAWQKLDDQQRRLAELDSRSEQAASAEALAELEGRLEEGEQERDAAMDEAIGALQDDFADYRDGVDETLDQVLDELSSEQDADERDWLHAEAAYLLRLANQRLQLERDVEGAAALLATADDRLKEADNPALVPVRREIAEELSALEAVPRVDRTGLWLALNAQQEQIAGEPLAQDIEEITADATIEEAPTGGWQQQLARFGGELKDLVTVREHDEALEALISPEQESHLRQSLRLVLEQAQLALLKEDQELFEASLDKALTLIEGYYDTDESGVQSVIERLGELQDEAIRPELPDISASQQALAEFIERRFESRDDEGDDA